MKISHAAFRVWSAALVIVIGIAFFGLTSLVLAWFQPVEGVAGPVTDLGYGALFGVLLTVAVFLQLRAPERKIAGMQQAAAVIPALLVGSALSWDSQNLVPALILLPALGTMLALHPARAAFLRAGGELSPALLAITLLGAIPLVVYAVDMGRQARDLVGPPHHVERLSVMAALAIAVVLAGLLAALKTPGWRIPAWCAGTAAIVLGLASTVFPDDPGAEGRVWGGVVIAGGVLFIVVGELERKRMGTRVRKTW